MADSQEINTSGNTTPATQNSATGSSSSPWDEELDLPETPKPAKPEIIGSLEPKKQSEENTEPFSVPENIEEKVGQKVPAENFIGGQEKASSANETLGPTINEASGPEPAQKPEPPLPNLSQQTATPKKNIFSLFQKKPKQSDSVSPSPVQENKIAQSQAQPLPEEPVNKLPALKEEKIPAKASFLPKNNKIIPVLGVIVFFVFLVGLTELGLLSIGVEKIYGAVGLEKLWGGLTSNPEQSFMISAKQMAQHQNFKMRGTITMSVDSTISSPITTPLISVMSGKLKYANKDINLLRPEKAIKTVASDADIYDLYDESSYSSDSSSTTSDTDTTDTTTTTSDSTADVAEIEETTDDVLVEDSSTDESATEVTEMTNTQEVTSSFEAETSPDAMKATINVESVSQSATIDLLLDNGRLLVQSDNFKFASNAAAGNWLSFPLPKLGGKSLSSEIFSISSSSGASLEGSREANEKINGIRCYKYRIDSVEIGDALSLIGITSDMIQNISGDIWIGINDKLLHKVSLKITTPITSSVSTLNVDIEFYDFGVENSIVVPSETEITAASSTSTVSASTSASTSTATTTSNDAQRKSDVGKILSALKSYKDATGSYPIAKDPLNINLSGNIIETALVPKYLASIPVDPGKNYFGYKSTNGKSCSVSARLDNTGDPEGQILGSAFLYIKYNEN